MSNIKIKVFLESEWSTYKSLRLASLGDSPDSFGSTYERESTFSEIEWKSRINPRSGPALVLPLIAEFECTPAGLAWGVVHSTESASVHVYQMWVSPEFRSKGIGQALLSRIISWAKELQSNSLSLAVATKNISAISLYNSNGFVPSGCPEPLRDGSPLAIQPMKLKLGANNAEQGP